MKHLDKSKMKRFVAVLMSLSFVLGMLFVNEMTVQAAEEETANINPVQSVQIGSVTLNTDNPYYHNGSDGAQGTADNVADGANAVFEAETGTLTLNNLHIDTDQKGIRWSYSFQGTHDLIVVLADGTDNRINNTAGAAIAGEDGFSDGPSLTIKGNGTLNATGATSGIWVWENVTIEGNAKVIVKAASKIAIANNAVGGTIMIKDNAEVIAQGATYGIAGDNGRVGTYAIQGGSLFVSGGTGAFNGALVVDDSLTAQVKAGVPCNVSAWDGTTTLNNYKCVVIGAFDLPEHSYAIVEQVTPTCTEAGKNAYYSCETCGKNCEDAQGMVEITDLSAWGNMGALGHEKTAVSAADATCTTPGNDAYYKCTRENCGKLFTDEACTVETTLAEVTKSAPGHDMELVEATAATCTVSGNDAYYVCERENCGGVFTDANATTATTVADETISPLGHDWATEWSKDEEEHWKECTRTECTEVKEKASHADDDSDNACDECSYVLHYHSLTKVDATPATCTTTGNKAHWKCTVGDCSSLFSDAEGTNPVTEADVTEPVLNHDMGVATCTEPATCKRSGCTYTEGVANGHDMMWFVTKEATATEEGQMGGACTVEGCEHVSIESIPVLKTEDNTGSGKIEVVSPETNANKAQISNADDVKQNVPLDTEEREAIGNGDNLTITLEVTDITATIDAGEKAKLEAALDGNTMGMHTDIILWKQVGSNSREVVEETAEMVRITITIPDNLKPGNNVTRSFKVLKLHNGVVTTLEDLDTVADTVTFETDEFSTYSLIYKDTQKPVIEDDDNDEDDDSGNDDTQAGSVSVREEWYRIYIVQRGDNLRLIARKCGSTVAEIVAANRELIKNPNLIYAGWQLKIPQKGASGTVTQTTVISGTAPTDAVMPNNGETTVYIVQKGDNLWSISKKYGCTVAKLIALNSEQINNPSLIYAGWEIKVPQK